MDHNSIEIFRWRLLQSYSTAGVARPRLCLANPAMVHSVQLFSPTASIYPVDGTAPRSPPGVGMDDSIYPLVGSIESIDHKIHADLVDRDFERAVLSVELLGPSSSKKADAIMHQLMRWKVVEALAWATSDVDIVPFQQLPDFRVESVDQELRDIGISDWKATVTSFCDTFRGDVNFTRPAPSLPRDKILASLVSKIQQTESSRHHATVISNMCGAALGIRGLFLVRILLAIRAIRMLILAPCIDLTARKVVLGYA